MTDFEINKYPNGVVKYYGGMRGAISPFLFLITGIVIIALSGAPSEKGFWPVLILALSLGLILARDRTRYCESVLEGMAQPIVMIMVMAWMLASILGVLMTETGLVDGLTWLGSRLNARATGMVVATFLICCTVAISTGSSFATILICGPVLYPAAGQLGAHLPTLAGAIIGGATLGDCIAPISDTTIAAAASQNTDIGGTVKSRLKYVVPAGILGLAGYAVSAASQSAVLVERGTILGSPAGLPMMIIPVIVIYFFLKGKHLLEGLLWGVLSSILLGLALGLLSPADVLRLNVNEFSAESLLIDGIERASGLIFFTILLMGLVGALRASGLLDHLIAFTTDRLHSVQAREGGIIAVVTAAVLLTTHSVVAILLAGDFARETGEAVGIHPHRRANLLSITVCIFPFLLPYFIPVLLMSTATTSGADFDISSVSPLHVGLHNFVAWGLFLMLLLAWLLGYGRTGGISDGTD